MGRRWRRRRRSQRDARRRRTELLVGLAIALIAGLAVVWPFGGDDDDGGGRTDDAAASPALGARLTQLPGELGCVKGPTSPRWTRCERRAPGIGDARSIAVTPDGRFAYVASVESSSVAVLVRDPRTGALRSLGGQGACVADVQAPRSVGCARRMRGLAGAITVRLSPDGRQLYVVAINSSAVTVFARDARTGRIEPLRGPGRCVADARRGTRACRPAPALGGARWIALSPDGRHAYVASPASDAITAFDRNPRTGALRPLPGGDVCVRDVRAAAPCAVAIQGLEEPRMATVAPDGRNVYAVGEHSYTVVALRRDSTSGALQPVEGAACVKDVEAPAEVECPVTARGLNYAFSVTVSPDGHHVYSTATASDAVAAFARDPATGALSPLPGEAACIADVGATGPGCRRSARGLDGASALTFDRRGRTAYLASFYGGAVAVLVRDRSSGALHGLDGRGACIFDREAPSTPETTRCPGTAHGMEGPREVVLSPDERHAYVPSSVGGAVGAFTRER